VGIFVYSYKNTSIYGLLMQFERYKNSLSQIFIQFMREAQQTASRAAVEKRVKQAGGDEGAAKLKESGASQFIALYPASAVSLFP
jgi:hypothetical protein